MQVTSLGQHPSAQALLRQMENITNAAKGTSLNQEVEQADSKDFTQLFGQALGQIDRVNDMQKSSESLQTAYEMGDKNVTLAKVMVETQKANLAFQALVTIRNKAIRAYQDIANMQV